MRAAALRRARGAMGEVEVGEEEGVADAPARSGRTGARGQGETGEMPDADDEGWDVRRVAAEDDGEWATGAPASPSASDSGFADVRRFLVCRIRSRRACGVPGVTPAQLRAHVHLLRKAQVLGNRRGARGAGVAAESGGSPPRSRTRARARIRGAEPPGQRRLEASEAVQKLEALEGQARSGTLGPSGAARAKDVALLVAAAMGRAAEGALHPGGVLPVSAAGGAAGPAGLALTPPPRRRTGPQAPSFALHGFHCAFDVPEAPVACVAWAPRRADLLAIAGGAGSVFVYSVPAATDAGGGVSGVRRIHTLDGGHSGRSAAFLDWGADGRTLVSCAPGPLPGEAGGRITQWDVESGLALRALDVSSTYGLARYGAVVGFVLHPDRSANLAALAFSEGFVAMVDLNVAGARGVRSTATFSERKRPLTCLGVDAANARLVVGDARGGVHLVVYARRDGALERGASSSRRGASVLRIETLARSPACGGAPLVLASRGDGTLTLFRVGEDPSAAADTAPSASALATPPPAGTRGGLLAQLGLLGAAEAAAGPALVRLADVAIGDAAGGGIAPAAFCRMLGLAAGASAEYLVVGDACGCVQVLGVALSPSGEPARAPQRLEGHAAPVAALAWSPDDALLATADHEGGILIWRTA